ncbi:ATP-binding protein, partial [Streptomyces sp. SID10815]|uniref:ATP-binding protein n=1 Tax=Streptomyces sp. SID10815 TaxID=2706027 RepID=UPI0013C57262
LTCSGGVLLTGPEGIGRTTLAAQLAADLGARGHRVLRCSPAPAERDTPFLGLIDLLAPVGDDALAALAAHERAVLEAALLRTAPPAGTAPVTGHAALVLRIAVRKVLARLTAAAPLLLVVDDAQWLDPPTAQILDFLARRGDGTPPVLATLRTDGPPDIPAGSGAPLTSAAPTRPYGPDSAQDLCPRPVRRVAVPPMTAHEIAELLEAHDQPPWPRPLLARLHHASGGNPRTALELGAALDERVRAPGAEPPDCAEPLPVPDRLRRRVLDRA